LGNQRTFLVGNLKPLNFSVLFTRITLPKKKHVILKVFTGYGYLLLIVNLKNLNYFIVFLNCAHTLILKINFFNKKYYFYIFLNKKYFKKQSSRKTHAITIKLNIEKWYRLYIA